MNDKIKSLMELSSQVDVICKAVEQENAAKDEAIIKSYRTRWDKMWDELDEFISAVNIFKTKGCHHIGKYTFGYPYGYRVTGKCGLTFATNTNFPTMVILDRSSGWGEIHRNSFDEWMNKDWRKSVEFLLDNWTDVKYQIEEDFQRRLKEHIDTKIKNAAETTEDIDEKMKLLGVKITKEIVTL